jgi:hypothetical protein
MRSVAVESACLREADSYADLIGSHLRLTRAANALLRAGFCGRCGIRTHGDPEATTAFEADSAGFLQAALTGVFPGQAVYDWREAVALGGRNLPLFTDVSGTGVVRKAPSRECFETRMSRLLCNLIPVNSVVRQPRSWPSDTAQPVPIRRPTCLPVAACSQLSVLVQVWVTAPGRARSVVLY